MKINFSKSRKEIEMIIFNSQRNHSKENNKGKGLMILILTKKKKIKNSITGKIKQENNKKSKEITINIQKKNKKFAKIKDGTN
jgi:hypothetical protein